MVHPFLRKLRHGARLTKDSEETLLRFTQSIHTVGAREDVMPLGETPHYLPLVVDGWACRYTTLENGRRQIISLFLPGDLCEPFGALPRFMDHAVGTLTPVVIAQVRADAASADVAARAA